MTDRFTAANIPQSNTDLPRLSIPLVNRQDLRESLGKTLEIIRLSGIEGNSIVDATARSNTKILVFTDSVMDQFAPTTRAFHAHVPNGHLLGLRETSLISSDQHFGLIRELTHEGVHVRQQQNSPNLWNPQHTTYIENIVEFERDAFATTAGVILQIALHEAQHMARTANRGMGIRETTMVQDWLQQQAYEAVPCLNAFEQTVLSTGNISLGIQSARRAVHDVFAATHEQDYRQDALQKQRESTTSAIPEIPRARLHSAALCI